MEINLVAESIKFIFLGMGVVFAFLIIMIFVLKAQGVILTRFPSQKEKIINITIQKSENTNNTEAAKIAAIVAAVQHHKNLKG